MTPVVGVATVLLILTVAVGGLLAVSLSVSEEGASEVEVSAVQSELQAVDTAVRRVAELDSAIQTVEVDQAAAGSGQLSLDDSADGGTITVTVGGQQVLQQALGESQPVRLGELRYETATGDVRVGYQAGGVFVRRQDGSVEVASAPPVDVQTDASQPSVSLPLYTLRPGDGDAVAPTGRFTVENDAEPTDGYPERYVPDDTDVTITIQSAYAEGWARILEAEFADVAGASVTYPAGDDQTVEVTISSAGASGHSGFYLHLRHFAVTAND